MELIKSVAILFFLTVALGTGLFSFLVNSKMTGAGFVRLITGICAGSLSLAVILFLSAGVSKMIIFVSILNLLIMILIYKYHQDEKSILMWCLWGLQNILLIFVSFEYLEILSQTGNFYFSFFFVMSSALFFGIVNYAMVLGHYYLVVPKLSEKPLINSMQLTWAVLLIKLIFSTISTLKSADFFAEETTLGAGYMFNWIMLIMRYLWGYVAVGVLSYFAWRLSKIRSTQSATGVMYVMVFFMIVGEIISLYLYRQYGLYI
ncbi:MAG: hypothetical protein ACOYL6_09790 [Bacteriovoracaceae bacterium]